jgi:hypothetical protein
MGPFPFDAAVGVKFAALYAALMGRLPAQGSTRKPSRREEDAC